MLVMFLKLESLLRWLWRELSNGENEETLIKLDIREASNTNDGVILCCWLVGK